MGFSNVIGTLAACTLLLTLSAAVPHSPANTFQHLAARQEPVDSEGVPCHYTQSKCQGIYPNDSTCNQTNIQQAIDDVGFLAHAALRALYTNATRPASPTELPETGVHPADHYYWFFQNNLEVMNFVANVFKNLTACADRHDCLKHVVFCEVDGRTELYPGACGSSPGRYGYLPGNPNQFSGAQSTINGVMVQKGGGVVFSCPAGRELPRNPPPCSTSGGADSLGSGLLAQLIQVDMVTQHDINVLERHAGWKNITVQDTDINRKQRASESVWGNPAQGMTLKEMGYGVNGNGLMYRGLANAENYVEFAKWSWDLNYGDAPFLTNQRCDDHFKAAVNQTKARPLSG